MTFLVILGFIGMCLFTLWMTVITVSVWYGEVVISGGPYAMTTVLAAVTAGMWALTYWINPFTISLSAA